MRIDLGQLDFIDPRLRLMATEVETWSGSEQTVTSLYRLADRGVHGQLPLRGLDWRCRNVAAGREMENYINSKWEYDPGRPRKKCCICHDTGKGFHMHLQVHPNTRRRR